MPVWIQWGFCPSSVWDQDVVCACCGLGTLQPMVCRSGLYVPFLREVEHLFWCCLAFISLDIKTIAALCTDVKGHLWLSTAESTPQIRIRPESWDVSKHSVINTKFLLQTGTIKTDGEWSRICDFSWNHAHGEACRSYWSPSWRAFHEHSHGVGAASCLQGTELWLEPVPRLFWDSTKKKSQHPALQASTWHQLHKNK